MNMTLSAKVLDLLRRGRSPGAISVELQVPLTFVEVMVDHYQRAGVVHDATSLCASGLGACHPGASPEAQAACVGCPLVLKKPTFWAKLRKRSDLAKS
ncbi:MAG: hypothetical protein Q4A71_07105 [Actinomycetaceae bacterium]|nr:hypothetical protein [Actinomycetaceae bacterium]